MKILIVDDLKQQLKLLRATLESEGASVIEAENGIEALAALKRESVDGIVSDVVMPKMGGYELCTKVRVNRKYDKIPFLFCTSMFTSPSDEKSALQLGADAFLHKPVSAKFIIDTIRGITSSGKKRRRPPASLSSGSVLRDHTDQLLLNLEGKTVELETLTSELRRLSRVVEQTADNVVVTNKDGIIEYVNPSFEKLTGYKKEEVIGKTPRILKSGELDDSFYKRLWETIVGGKSFRATFINRKKNGQLYFEEQTITPLVDESGEIISFVSTGKDVTEERRSKEALTVSNDQLRGLFDNLDQVLFSFDAASFKVLQVSPACMQVYGVSPSVFLNNPTIWKDAVIPEDKGIADDFEAKLFRGIPSIGEWRIVRADGIVKWIETRAKPTLDNEGNITRFYGIVTDISDRKRSKDFLRESETRFREMLENVKMIALTIDTSGKITFCNDFFLTLTGWRREQVIQKDWFSMFLPDGGKEVRKLFLGSLAAETIPAHHENPIITKSGELRNIQWNNTVLRDGAGTAIGTASIGEDVTDRVRAEKLRSAVYRISQEAGYSPSMEVLFGKVHEIVGEVMPTRNFYISLYDETQNLISFPYSVDEKEAPSPPHKSGKGLTEYVIRTGATLLCNPARHQELINAGEAELVGEPSAIWLGVPLKINGKTVGAMVVQDYENEHAYGVREKQILEFVSGQVASAIQRRQAEEELRALFGAMTDVVMILDNEGRYIKIAPTNPLNLYRPPNELLGRTIHEILEKQDADLILSKILECLSSGQTISYEYSLANGNKVIWFDARISPLSATTVFWIARDISKRKESEKKVEEQARLLELAGNAIIVRDLESRVTFWNKGAEQLYGWKLDEVLGKAAPDFLYRTTEEVVKARAEVLQNGSWYGELRQKTKSDKDVIVNSQWTLVRDETGNPKSILVINSDITAQKRLESQLLRAQRLESIGTLAGGIAHDLNNALGPILLGIQVVAKHVTDSRALQLLESMEGSAQRGANMVKQILAFARGFSGEFGLLNPKHVIEEVQRFIRETFPKNIELQSQVAKNLWNISGDATQLHQLLINLCVNARDAMPSGGRLTIIAENFVVDDTYAQMHAGLKSGPYILLKVTDTGSGMPKDILEKIFDPFFTTKDPGKGTGLGLSTVDTIVKGHGGGVDVYSEVNRGTTFRILMPALPGGEVKPGAGLLELPRGNGEMLLVVEDEVSLREMTKQTLEMFGYTVLTAADGTEAVTQFIGNRKEVQLVLTDMAMPIMDGAATIRALRKIDPAIRIIAASGQHDAISDAVVKRLEITRALTKPFTAEQLLIAVSEVLAGKE
ncbi:MAG: PAS domain S-box protein [Bacteroidota bacterium]